MQGEVKLQARVQAKTDSQSYARSAKGTDQPDDFTALLQVKKEQLKQPDREKAEEAVDGGKKEITLSQPREATARKRASEKADGEEDSPKEEGDEKAVSGEAKESAMQQLSAMEQLKAVMAGILPGKDGAEGADPLLKEVHGETLVSAVDEAGQETAVLADEAGQAAAERIPAGQELKAFNGEPGERGPELNLQAFEVPEKMPESLEAADAQSTAAEQEAVPQAFTQELSTRVTKEKTFDQESVKGAVRQEMPEVEAEDVPAIGQEQLKEETARDAGRQQAQDGRQEAADMVKAARQGANLIRETEKPGTSRQQARASQFSDVSERPNLQAIQEGNEGQAAGTESIKFFNQNFQESFFSRRTENIPLKTTPDALPQDLGKTLAKNVAEAGRTLTVELEPASLGKLTIRMIYDGGRAAVSIMATNPKTQELLNQKASEIAAILEEKTGQETVIYTQQPEPNQQGYDREPDGRGREEQREKRQDQDEHQQADSFAQQLRLGLV